MKKIIAALAAIMMFVPAFSLAEEAAPAAADHAGLQFPSRNGLVGQIRNIVLALGPQRLVSVFLLASRTGREDRGYSYRAYDAGHGRVGKELPPSHCILLHIGLF